MDSIGIWTEPRKQGNYFAKSMYGVFRGLILCGVRSKRDNSSSSSRAGTDCTGRVRSKRERKRKVHFDEVSYPLYTSRKVRRFKIMRSLGLAAPVGSPFNNS
ncbi:hypothetical protein L6452_24618 [Arctium lappa]|uniref:Uncharacterized protein n=1 Tax=Arctium lappa TaxID=4217 RepID=A0ACB9A9N3_ARCLA|nr:hypothetical protein L6452_24618 [Arctium lappa]